MVSQHGRAEAPYRALLLLSRSAAGVVKRTRQTERILWIIGSREHGAGFLGGLDQILECRFDFAPAARF